MENYGKDRFLSQEGYPSIDFTLLDRASGSIVSAPQSTVPFPRAGLQSYNDQSMPNHASHSSESLKHSLRGYLTPTTNQAHGVHDFFEQENHHQQHLGIRAWPSDGQSQYLLSRNMTVDESSGQGFHNQDNSGANNLNDIIGRPTLAAGMAFVPSNCMKASATNNLDSSRLVKETPSFPPVQTQVQKQMINAQRLSSPYSVPYNNGIPSRGATMGNLNYFGAQHPNQVNAYGTQYSAGVVSHDAPSHQFTGNQVSLKGALRPMHVEADHDAQARARATGFTELKSQRQLQQLLLAQQLKQQLDYSRQFQMLSEGQNQVSGTSYSALLHGPDTPPSHHQTMEETIMEEFRDQAAALPAANPETMAWTVDGSSYSQGFSNAPLQQQNQSLLSQLPSLEDSVDAGSGAHHLQDQNGPVVASYSGAQNVAEEYVTGGLRLPSGSHMGMPMPHQPNEIQTRNLGLQFGQNLEPPRAKILSNSNTYAGQSPQHPAEQMIRQKSKGNNLSQQVNILSQSQQHFQERQLSEQRMWNLLEQQHVRPPLQSFPQQNSDPLPQTNSLLSAKNTLKNGLSYSTSGYGQQLDSASLKSMAYSEQRQLLSSSAAGMPNRHMSVEEGVQHQYNIWNAMQGIQVHKASDSRLGPVTEGNFGSGNFQQGPHQSSHTWGVSFRPGSVSGYEQQGISKTQGSPVDVRASTAGNGVIPNQESLKARQESCWKEREGGGVVSDHTFQPFSGSPGASQGVWREYVPSNKVPTGVGTSGQSVDLFRPGSAFQPQMYFVPQASSSVKALQTNPTLVSAPHIVGQHVSEEHCLIEGTDYPYKQGQPNQNQAGANFMQSLSQQQALKLVPHVAEDAQCLLYKSPESQALSIEKQREVPWQQQIDPSGTSKISLAHLRGSQFSNQSSPQQVKLGLGPANVPQGLQQNDGASWSALSDMQVLDREVNTSSPFLQEHMLAASSSSAIAYGHGNNSKPVFSSNAMPSSSMYDEGPRQSGNEATREMDVSSSVMQGQSSNGFLGKYSYGLKAHGQPHQDARGMFAVQSQHSRDSSQLLSYGANRMQPHKDATRHRNDDANGRHLMQNQHMGNNSLRHCGSRAQTLNLIEPANLSQPSSINQVTGLDFNDQVFLGTVEASCLSSGSAQGDENKMMQKQQELMRKPGNRPFVRMHEPTTLVSYMDRQYTSDECRNQLKAYSDAPPGPSNESAPSRKVTAASSSEDSGQVPNENPQGKRRRQEHLYAKPLDFVPAQTDTPLKDSSRLPFQKPPFFVQGHSVQQLQSGRDISRNEDAAKGVLNVQTADGRITSSGQILRHRSLQQHNAFGREEASQCQVQPLSGTEKDRFAAAVNERLHQNINIAKNLNDQSLPCDGSMPVKPSACVGSSGFLLQDTKQGHAASPHIEGIKEEGSLPTEEGEGPTSPRNQRPLHQSSPLLVVIPGTEALHAKRRKKQVPSLIPWHIAAAQPRNALPSISDAELMWANATNRLPEKDATDMNEESKSGTSRATRRLRLTTQLVQRLITPPTSASIHGNTPIDSECAIYMVSKLNLEDACQLVACANGDADVASNTSTQCQARESVMTKCLENFMDRVKQSGMELARLDCSKSVSELRGGSHELEKLSIVNRLAKHHGIGFIMDSSDNLFIENTHESGHGTRKLPPQKYVTAAPLPRTLPEGVKCLSL